jgi:hypothetical protein
MILVMSVIQDRHHLSLAFRPQAVVVAHLKVHLPDQAAQVAVVQAHHPITVTVTARLVKVTEVVQALAAAAMEKAQAVAVHRLLAAMVVVTAVTDQTQSLLGLV